MTTEGHTGPTAPRRGARRIAFMNQKGGVGKTTTTVTLAAAAARRGIRTLVVDLDPQAHASLHLGVDPSERLDDASVYDILLEPASAWSEDHPHSTLREAILPIGENLWCLPSETDLAAAEFELGEQPDRNTRLRSALDAARTPAGEPFEAVLLDCPPSLGLLTLNGLAAAGEVIIPMQAHFLALQGVGKLLETVNLLTRGERAINPGLCVTGVVLCMHDSQAAHTREVVDDLESFFAEAREMPGLPWSGARVLKPAIRRNIKLAECPSFGQTIFDYAPDANGAKDYAALAETVFGGSGEADTEADTEAGDEGTRPVHAESAEVVEPVAEVCVLPVAPSAEPARVPDNHAESGRRADGHGREAVREQAE